ncbi:MAG: hypothetical protein ACI8V2_002536 [Candidatus Latescibacterota bacterium]|jgi:hypothetical protein
MAHLEIANAEVFYRTFAELLASGEEDKKIARKLGCPRGEAKRVRTSFATLEIVVQDTFNSEKLDGWMASPEGQRAQKQWEGQHRQQTMGGIGRSQKGGIAQQAVGKRQRTRQKV